MQCVKLLQRVHLENNEAVTARGKIPGNVNQLIYVADLTAVLARDHQVTTLLISWKNTIHEVADGNVSSLRCDL